MAVQTNGTLLGDRYRVIERLGSGGAATVFLCEDQRLGRKVAVKRLHAHSPEEMAQRLQREARLGASLNHPNLVSVFDTVTYDDGVLVVMEYVEGETLADALRRGPLATERALDILGQLAAALDHAHAHGVVHRDVKPANVLLSRGGVVKLADLGIGTALDATRITRSGVALGTPAYMAPEQVDGRPVTAAADVYALGAVAYEMLSGRKARTGRTPIEVANRAATEPPPDLRDAWPDAPAAAAEAIKRAMARDPERRQRSAGQLADELDAALGAPPTAATRLLTAAAPIPGRRIPAWVPLLLILAVAGIALALVLGGGGGGGGGADRQAASTHHHRTHRQRTKHKTAPAQTQQTQTQTQQPQTQSQTQAGTNAPAPTTPSGLNDQGKALIDSGRAAEAIPILQKALASFPPDQRSSLTYAYTLFNLADAYLRSGQPDKAIPLLQQRLKFNDQRDVVEAELRRAQQAAGQAPGSDNGGGPGKGKKKGHNEGD